MASEPLTLQEAIIYFASPDNCLNYLVARRWKNGVACPICGSKDVSFVASRRVWQCKTRHSKSQFSIKVGTIFEDSAISLDKWLLAMWMLANCKNGVSSYEISRATGGHIRVLAGTPRLYEAHLGIAPACPVARLAIHLSSTPRGIRAPWTRDVSRALLTAKLAAVPRDNQDENGATIKMRNSSGGRDFRA